MTRIAIFLVVFALSYLGVGIFRRWSSNKGLFDIPNERSSHREPVPRGGGVVIVGLCLSLYILIAFFYRDALSWGYLAAAVLIAVISWLDDLYSVPIVWRLLVHCLAATLLIWDVGYWREVYLPVAAVTVTVGVLGAAITGIWLVWIINAYNFMDGIDGLAATQAITAGLGWMAIGHFLGLSGIYLFCGVIAAASAGFLVHNWNPARIFMGDVGSAFLGFTFAAMPLIVGRSSDQFSPYLAFAGVLILWPFVFDTLLTLIIRLARGERVWKAHREHLYQRLVIKGSRHSVVTLVYGIGALLITAVTVLDIRESGISDLLPVLATVVFTLLLVVGVAVKKSLT